MPAPLFPANAHRFDPYRTYKFQVLIDGQPVAGLKKMGALKKKTEPIKWRAAGDPSPKTRPRTDVAAAPLLAVGSSGPRRQRFRSGE